MLEWDGSELHLTKLERLTTSSHIAKWVETEATDDTVIGIGSKISSGLSAALTELGFRSGEHLVDTSPAATGSKSSPVPGRLFPSSPTPAAFHASHLMA